MSREIRFRGKRKDNGEWVTGSLISFAQGERAILPSDGKAFAPKEKNLLCSAECYDVEPSTVGQYTGLTDKNGTRIFEGDIVQGYFFIEEIHGFIVYGDEAEFYIEREDTYGIGLKDAADWLTVVGNIHDREAAP